VVQVVSDSGELPLNQVYDLINDGENLLVHCESELKVIAHISFYFFFIFFGFSAGIVIVIANDLICAGIEREKCSVLHMLQAILRRGDGCM
jgi:hypothetical protein